MRQRTRIDTNLIHAGDRFKNYKQLCLALNLPIKSGESKNIQLRDLSSYFTWKRLGNKYIITEVYDQAIIKIDAKSLETKITGTQKQYSKLIEAILLYELNKAADNSICCTRTNLYKLLGLVNDNFCHPTAEGSFTSNNNLSSSCTQRLKTQIFDKCRTITYYSLKKLEEEQMITCSNTYLVTKVSSSSSHIATHEEKEEIDRATKNLMQTLKITNLNDAYTSGMVFPYIKQLQKLLKPYGILQVSPVTQIKLVPGSPIVVLNDLDLRKAKKQLNQNLRDYLSAKLWEEYRESRGKFINNDIDKKLFKESEEKLANWLPETAKNIIGMYLEKFQSLPNGLKKIS